jgi:hypothetical protein
MVNQLALEPTKMWWVEGDVDARAVAHDRIEERAAHAAMDVAGSLVAKNEQLVTAVGQTQRRGFDAREGLEG